MRCKPIAIIFFLFVLVSSSVMAQRHGVRIETVSPRLIETDPQKIVTATFRVQNETDREFEFLPEVQVPEGWQVISSQFPFTLKPAQEKTVFAAISIPLKATVGAHPIIIKISARGFPGINSQAEIVIRVRGINRIEIVVIEEPQDFTAGGIFKSAYSVVNNSNASSRFEMTAISQPVGDVIIEPVHFSLNPGESRHVEVHIETPSRISEKMTFQLELCAHALDLTPQDVTATVESSVYIYPQIHFHNRYETLDGNGGINLTWSRNETIVPQLRLDLSGDPGQDWRAKVHYIGPYYSRWSNRRFVQEDRFLLEYGYKEFGDISIGDQSIDLTPLTEQSFEGRGIDLKLRHGQSSLRVFASKMRFGYTPEQILGGQYVLLKPGILNIAITGHMNKKSKKSLDDEMKTMIGSVSAALNPVEAISLEGEFGVSNGDDYNGVKKRDTAYRIASSLDKDWLLVSGEYFQTGTFYQGNRRDEKKGWISARAMLTRELHLWGDISSGERNLERNPEKPGIEDSTQNIGFRYNAEKFGDFDVYYRQDLREDTKLHTENIRDRTANFQYSNRFGWLTFSGKMEYGRRSDLLENTDRKLTRYRLLFTADIHPKFKLAGSYFAGGYIWDTDDEQENEIRQVKESEIELDAMFIFDEKTQIQLNIGSTLEKAGDQDTVWVKTQIQRKIWWDGTINLRYLFNDKEHHNQSDAALELSFPLSIPVPWLKKDGCLEGVIFFDEDPPLPMVNVIVTLDGQRSVTNSNGRFMFTGLGPGQYMLGIDQATLGFDKIPSIPVPVSVKVVSGINIKTTIPVVRPGFVSGRVQITLPGSVTGNISEDFPLTLEELISNSGKYSLSKSEESQSVTNLKGVAVLLTNGIDRFVQTTDSAGEFSFNEIRPGHWTLKPVEGQIPEYFGLKPAKLDLDIKSGERLEAGRFVVSPQLRKIIINRFDHSDSQ